MKNLYMYSLRFKIIFSLILVTTLFLGAFQAYAYYSLKTKLLSELNEEAEQKIERLSRDLESPVWEIDEQEIKKILQSEFMDEQIHSIRVSGDQNILETIDRDKEAGKHAEKNSIHRTASVMHDGVVIGTVELYLTKDLMDTQLKKALTSILIVGLSQIVIVIAFLWIILQRLILTPVEALMVSTKKIARGDYPDEALDFGDDEIGVLNQSITKMKDNIQEREYEILSRQEELKGLKERLEYAIGGAQDGLWDWNIQTNEIYFSTRWKEMLGYRDDELPDELDSWTNNVHPDDLKAAEDAVAYSHEKPGRFYENIHRLKHKNGNWIWILDRGQTIFDTDGKAVRMVGFHTDITKQKELERELLEQEEMMIAQSRHVAMGEMIGMIAHQWRQPITVIAMGANNMLLDVQFDQISNESIEKEAREILTQTEHLSKTIDDFRNFFRPNKNKEETKIIDILMEAKEMIGKSLENHNITLSIQSNENETIHTYSREILQVILNIFKNAQEAMDHNMGNLGRIDACVEDRGDAIMITISDNAGGIEESVLNRIFEPYFSTKDKKTGTGLGLYMSKTIIDKHLHGSINVHNIDGGVMFTITLPKTIQEGISDV